MTMAPILGPIGNLGDHARLYAGAGVEVFPVNPRDKTPLVSQYRASTDIDTVTAWWEQWPGALIGHRISADHVVLDVDPRHGGHLVWAALREEVGGWPVTRGHMSGRGDGGGHIWWLNPGIRLTVTPLDAWARDRGLGHEVGTRWSCGIDILHRDHRYTILPPSPHPDTAAPYRWIDGRGLDVEPAVMPQLLVDLTTDDSPPAPAPPPRDPDPESIADWYSETHLWGDLLGRHGWTLRGGDGESDGSRWRHPAATSSFSATLRHRCLFVYSPNTPFEVTTPGSPQGYTLFAAYATLDHADDQSAAAGAARIEKDGVPGADDMSWVGVSAPSVAAEPTPVAPVADDAPEAAETPLSKLRAAVLSTASIMSLNPPEHLIGSWLNRNSLATLYGPSGSGKTFLALDWALHVATSSEWHGRPVEGGPVLYVIAEGASGIGDRLDAWATYHRLPTLADMAAIHWLPQAVNLSQGPEVDALRTIVAELGVKFVVIDTLARCTVGVEENSARDMGLVVANLDALRRASGACILSVHHTGKDTTGGARGSSALRGAMDTEVEVVGTESPVMVKVTKQKDGPEANPRWLGRLEVGPSVVLVNANQMPERDDLPASAVEAIRILPEIELGDGVTVREWQMACGKMPESTFLRVRKRLELVGLVENFGSPARPRYRLTASGRDVVERRDQ